MAKKTLVRDQDKFMLRLPDGMRDRIKAKADRAGMSMNEAIVWALERWFPPPVSLEDKIKELAEMVSILKGDDTYKAVDDLISEVHETLEGIAGGKIGALPGFKNTVADRLERWQEEQEEGWRALAENPFDDRLYPNDPSGDVNPATGKAAQGSQLDDFEMVMKNLFEPVEAATDKPKRKKRA